MEKITDKDRELLKMAADIALKSVDNGGGPFGAVIVKDGKVIASASNSVTIDNDPTAHAEVNAVRAACRSLGAFKLEGCTVYSSCEPCPMCLSALYWAGVARIFYGNTKEDAAGIGFSDKFIYDELSIPRQSRHLPCVHVTGTDSIRAFRHWQEKEDKTEY